MNKAILIGRITKDPELKKTPQGVSVVTFAIAINRNYKDANGEYPADFINCVAWRQAADYMSNYIKKGNLISVEGRIQVRTYQNPSDNQTRYVTEVLCENVSNLSPRDINSSTGSTYNQKAPVTNEYKNNNNNNAYQPDNTFDIDVSDDDLPF
ncbi:MAG: single-stranded DNA-binding protein [Anaeroplasmataceae bacterium]